MRGGTDWNILGQNFNYVKEFTIFFQSNKFNNYYIDDKEIKLNYTKIFSSDNIETEKEVVGKLINGKYLKINKIIPAGEFWSGKQQSQLKIGIYLITKVKKNEYVASELTVEEVKITPGDKEFILFNSKERIIKFIKEKGNEDSFKNNVGIRDLTILNELKTNYQTIISLKLDTKQIEKIDNMLDNFVTLLKNITM